MITEFSDNQFSDVYSDGVENSYWNIARNRIILKYIKRGKFNNILEVGCGRGIVITYLHRTGLSVTGVELGNSSCIGGHDVKTYYNTDAISLPEEIRTTINTIALFDVIEHIATPVDFIKNLADKYPNTDSFIITVPARKELWTNFDDYFGHFRRYDMEMIKQLAVDMGFEVSYSRYFFNTLYLLIYINKLFFKQRKVNFNPPKGFISKNINKFAGMLFYAESYFLPRRCIGSSILCILKKRPTE